MERELLNPTLTQTNLGHPHIPSLNSRWRPPRANILKFNLDAQFDVSTGHGNAGVIYKDDKGRLVIGITSKVFARSALVVEALALI